MECKKCKSVNCKLLQTSDPGFDDEYKTITQLWECKDCGKNFTTQRTVCAHIEE